MTLSFMTLPRSRPEKGAGLQNMGNAFRWNRKGIEMLVNLINITYCAMKLLPYQEEAFSKYRKESVQDFRFALNERIRQEVFFATFVKKSENRIKSSALMRTLKYLVQQKEHYL